MNILFIPWRDYSSMLMEGFRTREANLLKELERNPMVDVILCVNQPTPHKVFEPLKKLLNSKKKYNSDDIEEVEIEVIYERFFSKLTKVSSKVYCLDITYFFPKGKSFEEYTFIQRILSSEIIKALDYLGVGEYITWLFDLKRIDVSNKLKQSLLVFDAIDNLLEHDQYQNQNSLLKRKYEMVAKSADIIFTVSSDLKENLFENKENVYFVPNGIDISKYEEKDYDLPLDLPRDGKPIITYIGVMQERIDKEILLYSIRNLPDYNFIFIGPVLSPKYLNDLNDYSNVYFLGAKKHTLIPSYLYWSDVCIMPHKVNKFTKSMNPLKLYEYLACGKEIVTTPIPPTDLFKEVVNIASTKEEFLNKISDSLGKSKDSSRRKLISSSVIDHSWSNRVDSMLEKIDLKI